MPDFGAKLRDARERRGISLRQIETKTKVSVAALESLERNDLSRLPGGIFARALVRSYASEVGLDPDATVLEFTERFNLDPPATAEAALPPGVDGRVGAERYRITVLVTILLATLAVAAIILLLTLAKAPDDQSNRPAPDRPLTDRSADGALAPRVSAKSPLS